MMSKNERRGTGHEEQVDGKDKTYSKPNCLACTKMYPNVIYCITQSWHTAVPLHVVAQEYAHVQTHTILAAGR